MGIQERLDRNWAGWHQTDDDQPRPPERDEPLASGKRKRWLRERRTMGPSGAFWCGVFATAINPQRQPLKAAPVTASKPA